MLETISQTIPRTAPRTVPKTVALYTVDRLHEYTFTVYEIGEDFPDTSGLYIFAVPEDGGFRYIYFGHADSLKDTITDKLAAHAHYDCITREGATHVLVYQTGHGPAVRSEMMAVLMAGQKGVCNP